MTAIIARLSSIEIEDIEPAAWFGDKAERDCGADD